MGASSQGSSNSYITLLLAPGERFVQEPKKEYSPNYLFAVH